MTSTDAVADSGSASGTMSPGTPFTSLWTMGGHGLGAAWSGRTPLLRAQKSFCGGEPLGTGPA